MPQHPMGSRVKAALGLCFTALALASTMGGGDEGTDTRFHATMHRKREWSTSPGRISIRSAEEAQTGQRYNYDGTDTHVRAQSTAPRGCRSAAYAP